MPVVATYDLHANVSDANVTLLNGFIGYRTNPHLDMRERGAEAAGLLRRLLAGTRTFLARIRLPIVPPTVTQLTGKDAPNRPYGELIDLGQQRMTEAPYAGRVLNVSVMGGFAYRRHAVQRPDRRGDRHRPGCRRRPRARDRRGRLGAARPVPPHADQPRAKRSGWRRHPRRPLIFADVADNPGGGGRGNTMAILQAFHAAGVQNALVGVIHDPALAAEAHERGLGATFDARFNRRTMAATNSPSRSPPRLSSPACATSRSAAGAASTPTTRWISAKPPR